MRFPSVRIARLSQGAAIAFASLIFCAAAQAQIPTSGNAFFGYSFENAGSTTFDLSNLGRLNLNGWEASVEGKVLPWVGFVADVGGHYGSQSFVELTPVGGGGPITVNTDGTELTFLFGPRVSVPVGKFRPFAEALFGGAHIKTTPGSSQVIVDNSVLASDTSFATAVGGGIDYKIIRPIAWRFQGDYVQTRFFGATQNNVRLSTGIVLRF